MRDVEQLKVDYLGYEKPITEDEVMLEILGLELAVKCAEQRIALMRQSLKVAKMREADTLKAAAVEKLKKETEE